MPDPLSPPPPADAAAPPWPPARRARAGWARAGWARAGWARAGWAWTAGPDVSAAGPPPDPRLALDADPGWGAGGGSRSGPGPRDRVPLRTVTVLRWIAIAGQVAALLFTTRVMGLHVAVGAASVAIGASVVVNLLATFLAPPTRRLLAGESAALLAFDVVQLGVLLAVTGGLDNPFAVLLLAPVAIAASVLGRRATLALVLLTVAAIAGLGTWHLPIGTAEGHLESPPLFRLGFGLALAVGVCFVGLYARQVSSEVHAMNEALEATRAALARAQRLADLDGVVAAAAHELGTPLATIKLTASEMVDELEDRLEGAEGDPGLAHLLEDARLLRAQADRCRDILREMGRAGRRDPYLDRGLLEAVLREAAEPHMGRGVAIEVTVGPARNAPGDGAGSGGGSGPVPARQPDLPRRPEIVHGLRNLVQNAVDFAKGRVRLRAEWTASEVSVAIADDGPGFSPGALERIGEPFMRRRTERPDDGRSTDGGADGPAQGRAPGARPGYDGMGLGLFIAKTLLERTGARLTFANAAGGGALVVVCWPRAALAAPAPSASSAQARAPEAGVPEAAA